MHANLSSKATPQENVGHRKINLRLPTHSRYYGCNFETDGRALWIRVEVQLVFDSVVPILGGALAGFGLAYVAGDPARPRPAAGRLCHALDDRSPPLPGWHRRYPTRLLPAPAFARLPDALDYRH